MNVDVEIYISQLVKFFKENPKDLNNLIPADMKDKFFEKCREVCLINSEKGDEIALTRKQMLDICVQINTVLQIRTFDNDEFTLQASFQKTPIGFVCLN